MAFRAINAAAAALFLFSAALQYNDPDGFLWVVVYGAAAVPAALAARRGARIPWVLPALVAVAAFAWAAAIAPGALGRVAPADLFRAFEMRDAAVEENREMIGLAITGIWMTVLAMAARRARR